MFEISGFRASKFSFVSHYEDLEGIKQALFAKKPEISSVMGIKQLFYGRLHNENRGPACIFCPFLWKRGMLAKAGCVREQEHRTKGLYLQEKPSILRANSTPKKGDSMTDQKEKPKAGKPDKKAEASKAGKPDKKAEALKDKKPDKKAEVPKAGKPDKKAETLKDKKPDKKAEVPKAGKPDKKAQRSQFKKQAKKHKGPQLRWFFGDIASFLFWKEKAGRVETLDETFTEFWKWDKAGRPKITPEQLLKIKKRYGGEQVFMSQIQQVMVKIVIPLIIKPLFREDKELKLWEVKGEGGASQKKEKPPAAKKPAPENEKKGESPPK